MTSRSRSIGAAVFLIILGLARALPPQLLVRGGSRDVEGSGLIGSGLAGFEALREASWRMHGRGGEGRTKEHFTGATPAGGRRIGCSG